MNELVFFEQTSTDYAELAEKLAKKGVREVSVIVGDYQDSALEDILARKEFRIIRQENVIGQAKAGSALVILEENACKLSQMLISFIDAENLLICAPVTSHYMTKRPAFTNGIMKSGTHFLQNLMETFGFKSHANDELPNYNEILKPGYYYNLQHMNRNYLARPFDQIPAFISAFCSSVVLFIVRDPRDIVVSMAHYLKKETQYHILQSSFNEMSHEERISSIINGKYPMPIYVNRETTFRGSIRDMFMEYADWIQFPFANTVFLRYEDLVGPDGGGDEFRQMRSLWAAQLAMHVPGIPQDHASNISKDSSTFRKGVIESYREEFTGRNHNEFISLNQDFVELFGYGEKGENKIAYPYFPNFKGEIPIDGTRQPCLLQEGYFKFNIISYGDQYFALKQSAGPIDLDKVIVDSSRMQALIARGELIINASLKVLKVKVLISYLIKGWSYLRR